LVNCGVLRKEKRRSELNQCQGKTQTGAKEGKGGAIMIYIVYENE
jgi:hypothetical protein